jgi:hypothetical protein
VSKQKHVTTSAERIQWAREFWAEQEGMEISFEDWARRTGLCLGCGHEAWKCECEQIRIRVRSQAPAKAPPAPEPDLGRFSLLEVD